MLKDNPEKGEGEIAIIGMVGRFPGARNLDEFWDNLTQGVESLSFFTDEELRQSGINPEAYAQENYVRAGGVLDDIELFDAGFFAMSPREAQITDPQHRLFLECASEVLESAGYDGPGYSGRIGIFGGVGMPWYFLRIVSDYSLMLSLGVNQAVIGNEKDHLTTRVSYKLDLRGPSTNVQTACSTSLVAAHMACQSLLNFECDMALAGGVSINLPQKQGYLYEVDSINSPDGHCRAFDVKAHGTVNGNGIGLVLLKRLNEAIADRDIIHAVIKGSAVNNDGHDKVGYTAPSVRGQAEVIAEAQAVADVLPDDISYIEAHGTATVIGDPIEIAALTQVFRASTTRQRFCGVGSVKTNIGHLGVAAGVAGLIKTVLAIEHRTIPPSLHFEMPNPNIDFSQSPFFVNDRTRPWENVPTPLRAGVSSFGMGGTNAHVILEEPPPRKPSGPSRPWHLLTVSAKTPTALEKAKQNLAEHFRRYPDLNPADVAYTLQIGRTAHGYRDVVLYQSLAQATRLLESGSLKSSPPSSSRHVSFMFPGLGAQHVRMAADLCEFEPIFRETVGAAAEVLSKELQIDLLGVLYPEESQADAASSTMLNERVARSALFIVEYALSRLLIELSIKPNSMFGSDVGECVAGCLAKVFSLEEALRLVSAKDLRETLATVNLNPPSLPFISGASGKWITNEQATDQDYWLKSLSGRAQFDGAMQTLSSQNGMLLSVGPGQGLAASVKCHPMIDPSRLVLSTLPNAGPHSSEESLVMTLGKLWLNQLDVNWTRFYKGEQRNRLQLPTYHFERERYWIESTTRQTAHLTVSPQIIASPAEQAVTSDENGRKPPVTYDAGDAPPETAPDTKSSGGEIESTIADVWRNLLGVSQIDRDDDFFDLGGDSLIGARLVARLAESFEVELTVGDLFEASTITKLSQLILEKKLSPMDPIALTQLLTEAQNLSRDEPQ